MIHKIRIVNFRQIEEQTINLSQSLVIVGPNNGGKTTLLQAISLFALTIRIWVEEHDEKKLKRKKTRGVAINLENMLNIPVPEFREIWRNLRVREGDTNKDGKPITRNIRIEIHAEGVTRNKEGNFIDWRMGFEYDYFRNSLVYARPTTNEQGEHYEFPDVLQWEQIGYLPSIAALKPFEDKLERGSILRNIGNGNTSDVLRNICYYLYTENSSQWEEFRELMKTLFRIDINTPQYSQANGLLKMNYNENDLKNIDLSSLGSGSKQAILLFAYMLAFPNTVHLLDEPDAHLEAIRQSRIYNKISDLAKKNNSQIIVASHSARVLRDAFGKNNVVSSVFGTFEELNDSSFSGMKNLLENYGYEELIIAKQRPFILYYEGDNDLDFLEAFGKKFGMTEFLDLLENRIYPYPLGGNDTKKAKNHFSTLQKFIPELRAYALFDNLEEPLRANKMGWLSGNGSATK